MHQNKQLRPTLFVVSTRLYSTVFVLCSFDDESERGQMPEVHGNFKQWYRTILLAVGAIAVYNM